MPEVNKRTTYGEMAVWGGVFALLLWLTAYLGVVYFGFGKRFAGFLISVSLAPLTIGGISFYRFWLNSPPKEETRS